MSRPLRIQFPGAVYHVTSRGNRREPIYIDSLDRERMLELLGQAMSRYDAEVFAYCQMGNHYHLILRTRRANLSLLMRHLNGEYARSFNSRHGLAGHLFQRRFHAVLVDSDAYLMQACRYVELNPVRAGLVARPGDWKWSSFLANIQSATPPDWLATSMLHEYVLKAGVETPGERLSASVAYARLVDEGRGENPWAQGLRNEIYLGDEHFVERMQARMQQASTACAEIPVSQRQDAVDGCKRLMSAASRAREFRSAYVDGGMTMRQIALRANLSVSRISRLIARAELDARKRTPV